MVFLHNRAATLGTTFTFHWSGWVFFCKGGNEWLNVCPLSTV